MGITDRPLLSWSRARWLAPAGLVLGLGLCLATLLVDYRLRLEGLWAGQHPADPVAASREALRLLALLGSSLAFLSFWASLALGLGELGRRRWWPRWGWLSLLLIAALVRATLVGPLAQLGWFGTIEPAHQDPAGWLTEEVHHALGQALLWLTFTSALVALHWLGHALVALGRWHRRDHPDAPEGSSSPRVRLGPAAIAISAAALAGGALGATGIAVVGMSQARENLAVGLITALLSAALVGACLRLARTTGQAVIACLLGGVAAALFCSPLSMLALTAFNGDADLGPGGPLMLASLAATIGASIAAPLGLLFSALYLVPTLAAHRLGRSDPHEAVDGALRTVGLWLLLVGVGCFAMARFGIGFRRSALPEAAALTVTLVGALGATLGALRMRGRRRWLARVWRGEVGGWAVVDLPSGEAPPTGLRPLLATKAEGEALLIRQRPGPGAGAYRRGDERVALAWLPALERR